MAIGFSSDDPIEAELARIQEVFRSGDHQLADQRTDELIRRHPERWDVQMAKGIVAGALGDAHQALGRLAEAVRMQPNNVEAHAWAAHYALQLGKFGEAEVFARGFCELAPREPKAHDFLARALRGQKRTQEALAAVDRALELSPNAIDVLVLKARLLDEWNLPALAIDLYRRALSLGPAPAAAVDLAIIHLKDGRPAEALGILQEASPLMSERQRPFALIARAYTLLDQAEQAEEYWSLAERQSDDRRTVVHLRARAEITMGRFKSAEALLTEELTRDPESVESFVLLARCRKILPGDQPLIERMEARLSAGDLASKEASDLNYAIGKAYDDVREFGRAIKRFDEANRIRYELFRETNEFDLGRARAYGDFHIKYFSEENLPGLKACGLDSSLPLFVVGMPRSGTTLTESILGAHSKVKPGGEQAFWTDRAVEIFRWSESPTDVNWPLVIQFASDYLDLVDPRDPEVQYAVDKNPSNFALSALLHCTFPNAKIVHLKRRAVDNVLSIWTTNLGATPTFTSDRHNLVFAYREHVRLLRHLKETLPDDRFQSYRYEDLTSRPSDTIPELLRFVGLEVEPACYAPEKTQRAVLTPSVYQVREPIHTGSQDRWSNYEPWLGPFAELLDETEFP
jgi:tetratricopeptide (TPR) repeat protein